MKSMLSLVLLLACGAMLSAGEIIFADGKLDGKLGRNVKLEGTELVWTFQPKQPPFQVHPADVDFSAYNALAITFDASAAGGKAVICLASQPDDVKEFCYYSTFVTVEKAGVQTWTVPFSKFTVNRKPVGWTKINAVMISFDGWNLENQPGLVLKVQSIKLIKQ